MPQEDPCPSFSFVQATKIIICCPPTGVAMLPSFMVRSCEAEDDEFLFSALESIDCANLYLARMVGRQPRCARAAVGRRPRCARAAAAAAVTGARPDQRAEYRYLWEVKQAQSTFSCFYCTRLTQKCAFLSYRTFSKLSNLEHKRET